MDAELERLINALIEETSCYNCGMAFSIEASELDTVDDGLYTSNYSCPGCEADYALTIEEEQQMLSLRYPRTDENAPEETITPFQSFRKEALQRQSHPVKDLIEGYTELNAALALLSQNRKRIVEACETLNEEGIGNPSEEFRRKVHTDVHNYMASAYSFHEILENVKPNLPTGGPVEKASKTYEDERKVITGLRTYAQHQFTIPISYSVIAGEGTEDHSTTITVDLEEVDTIESDIERYPPDGYAYGADWHYKEVEHDYIDIESRINLHYEAAVELVDIIAEYAEETRGDEIKDYRESVRFMSEQDGE